MRRGLIAGALGIAVWPTMTVGPSVQAATADTITSYADSRCHEGSGECDYWTDLVLRAGPEANLIDLLVAPDAVTVRDAAAEISVNPSRGKGEAYVPGDPLPPPCSPLEPRVVLCPVTPAPMLDLDTGVGDDRLDVEPADGGTGHVRVSLGDGADMASVRLPGEVRGGTGNDVLVGTAAGAWLMGEAGNDTLTGEAGVVTLDGGPGDDVLKGSDADDWLIPGSGQDHVDGGLGTDTISYKDAGVAVRVDLAREQARSVLGTAQLRGIEHVVTGPKDDVLIGDAAANQLNGGRGDNTIRAGGGDDTLIGIGSGSSCGAGTDTVDLASLRRRPVALAEPLPRDCERARFVEEFDINPHPRVTTRYVTISGVRGLRYTSRISWELRAGGRMIAKRTTVGRSKSVRLRLNVRGRECVNASPCRATLRVDDLAHDYLDRNSLLPLLLTKAL